MITPTIHMNGSSRESLLNGAIDTGEMVRLAMEAVQRNAPNGRDYYPQGPEAFTEAMNAHLETWKTLKRIYDSYQRLAEAIDDSAY